MILKKLNKKQISSGFTLIETTMAILIMGISVVVLLGLQVRLNKSVFKAHSIYESISLVSNFFSQADKSQLYKKTEPTVQKNQDSGVTITYTPKKSDKKIKGAENIVIENLKVKSSSVLADKEETFFALHFLPQTSKDTDKSEGKSA